MKNKFTALVLTLLLLLITTQGFSQKLEKIKGSKNVITSEIALDSVVSLELSKGIKLTLVQGNEEKLIIYADDNLHEVVDVDLVDGKLSLDMLNRIATKKEFELTLQLIDLKELTMNGNSKLAMSSFFKTSSFNIKLNDKATADILLEATDVILFSGSDKSKAEVNFKATKITYELDGTAKVKGNSNATNLQIELKDRATIDLSGKSEKATLIANDTSKIKMTDVLMENTQVIANGRTNIYVHTNKVLTLQLNGESKVYFYGNATVDLQKFEDTASLFKKE